MGGDVMSSILTRFLAKKAIERETRKLPPMLSFRFDDGFLEDYTITMPALRDRGLKGSFYPISLSVVNGTTGRMNAEQIKEIAYSGSEIGSHTHTHYSLPTLTDEQLVFELVESKRLLEEWTQKEVVSLAPPGHGYDARVARFAHGVYEFVNLSPVATGKPDYSYYGYQRNTATKRMSNTTFANLKALIDEAIEKNVWLTLQTHRVLDVPFGEEGNGHMALSVFVEMLDYVNTLRPQSLDVVTIKEGSRRVQAHVDPRISNLDGYFTN
jgi:peptidoglycan/xylan/chitin deacetylase (PgdA/CDA1 family)